MADIFSFDDSVRDEGLALIAGIDEAGRGPLAGPVVASAVILKRKERIEGLRDSKKLSSSQIEKLFWDILVRAISIGVGVADAGEIDRINILNATKLAMARAVKDLPLTPDVLLIDSVRLSLTSIEQRSYIRGEAMSASIAAASIVAKHVRDSFMKDYHKLYPDYGFDRHKGYATRMHIQKIRKFGPCPIHRNSFSPVTMLTLFDGDQE